MNNSTNHVGAPQMGNREWYFLLLLSILWGGSFFLSKIAVAEVPPLTLVLYRVSLAAMVLFGYLRLSKIPIPRGIAIWQAFALMGLINNAIPFSLLFWGQTQIGAGLASILNATTPIFSVILAHLFTRDEPMTSAKLAGALVGFCGVATLLAGSISSGSDSPIIAMLACLGAALSYGFASVYGRGFSRRGIKPTQVALGQLIASSIWMLPLVLWMDPIPIPWLLSTHILLAVVALATVSTAFAYLLFFRILATGGAVNISLVTLLVPASAILLGAVFLNESLAWTDWAGMALIAVGLLITDGRTARFIAGRAD